MPDLDQQNPFDSRLNVVSITSNTAVVAITQADHPHAQDRR